MLEELNRVAKEVARIRDKYGFVNGIDANYSIDGSQKYEPYIQITGKRFWDIAEKANAEVKKGYYFEEHRQYYFFYDGVKYFMLSKEEEN